VRGPAGGGTRRRTHRHEEDGAVAQWDLEVLAASLRRDSDDLSLYAVFLLNTLSAALPPHMVRVERKAGLFGRVKDDAPVLAVSLLFGDRRFTQPLPRGGDPGTANVLPRSPRGAVSDGQGALNGWI